MNKPVKFLKGMEDRLMSHNRKMSGKSLIKAMFVVWIGAISVLAVVPHSDDGIMVASNVTSSGMEKHIVGYFLATLLFYYGCRRTDDGGQTTEDRRRRTDDGGQTTED